MNRGNPTGYPETHQAIMGYDRWGAGIIILGKKKKVNPGKKDRARDQAPGQRLETENGY
jgi:hypothetical protein